MFVATANVGDTIPAPLRDRMEIIEIPGYTRKKIQQELEFIGVQRVDEVLRAALEDPSLIKLDLSIPDSAKTTDATPAS